MNPYSISPEQARLQDSNFIARVYAWMSLALFLTALTAFFVASSPGVLNVIIGNKLVFYGLMIAQVGLVFYLSSALLRLSAETATALFLAYSILMGLTLSVIFLIYTTGSIASTFLITAGIFGIMSAYGFYTKKDLTTIGNLAFMGLIGVIIA
ncbi:MAG: Bax inhibitor-1/YccA family protein, partial [Saprospiraceae bacterium]